MIKLDDTPFSVHSSFIIKVLKDEFVERIDHKASFSDIHICKDKFDNDVLCTYDDDYYGRIDTEIVITTDHSLIELYKAIKILDKTL